MVEKFMEQKIITLPLEEWEDLQKELKAWRSFRNKELTSVFLLRPVVNFTGFSAPTTWEASRDFEIVTNDKEVIDLINERNQKLAKRAADLENKKKTLEKDNKELRVEIEELKQKIPWWKKWSM